MSWLRVPIPPSPPVPPTLRAPAADPALRAGPTPGVALHHRLDGQAARMRARSGTVVARRPRSARPSRPRPVGRRHQDKAAHSPLVQQARHAANSRHIFKCTTPLVSKGGNYPPAEPGALEVEPLKAALIVHCPNYTCPIAEDLTWQPCTRTSSHTNNASDCGSSLTSLKLRLGPS